MPRKKKSSRKNLYVLIVILIVVGISVVAWHDGVIGATSIQDINEGDVNTGTVVTVKGEVTAIVSLPILGTRVFIADLDDDSYGLTFEWDGDIPAVGSIVVVRGEVNSIFTLTDVTSVQVVWIFK